VEKTFKKPSIGLRILALHHILCFIKKIHESILTLNSLILISMCVAYIKYKQFLVLKGTFNPDVFQEDLKASQVYNWVQFN
jgi:hypothetical protein